MNDQLQLILIATAGITWITVVIFIQLNTAKHFKRITYLLNKIQKQNQEIIKYQDDIFGCQSQVCEYQSQMIKAINEDLKK